MDPHGRNWIYNPFCFLLPVNFITDILWEDLRTLGPVRVYTSHVRHCSPSKSGPSVRTALEVRGLSSTETCSRTFWSNSLTLDLSRTYSWTFWVLISEPANDRGVDHRRVSGLCGASGRLPPWSLWAAEPEGTREVREQRTSHSSLSARWVCSQRCWAAADPGCWRGLFLCPLTALWLAESRALLWCWRQEFPAGSSQLQFAQTGCYWAEQLWSQTLEREEIMKRTKCRASKNMHVRLTGDSNLSPGVSVDGCLCLCGPVMDRGPVQGVSCLPSWCQWAPWG